MTTPQKVAPRQYIVAAVLVATILVITALYAAKPFCALTPAESQQRVTVAGAQEDLAIAEHRLDRVKWMTNSADYFLQHTGLTNTLLDRAITRLGTAEVQEREQELITARFVAAVASNIVAADFCLRKYNEFNAVQEAAAVLNLSGFENVIIRPVSTDEYQLMAPLDLASNALAALQEVRVSCVLVIDDPVSASRTLSMAKAHGIRATARLLKRTDSTDSAARSTGIFVRHSDEATVRAILEDVVVGK